MEVKNAGAGGLNVRSDHLVITSPNNSIGKVWDGQRLVTFGTPASGQGCPSPYQWRQIDLPQDVSSSSGEGWVCDQYAQLVSSPAPPQPDPEPVVIKGDNTPDPGGEFLDFTSGPSQLNNTGDVIFGATIDTNGDGLPDAQGFFKESQGVKSKIVRTGERVH